MPSSPHSPHQDHKRSGCATRVVEAFVDSLDPEEEELPEVERINNYAVFMGYLSMGVRGLGFLVVTWTTVVLLGGFVSVLGEKDFWCLAVITLSQTVGAFDVFLNEKLSSIWHAYRGLFITSFSTTFYGVFAKLEGDKPIICTYIIASCLSKIMDDSNCLGICLIAMIATMVYFLFWVLVSVAKAAVQALMLVVILVPVATLYMFGLYISTSISLWRLIQHDYGDDGGANMKPALDVLYSLVVIQGLVFCYKIIFACQEKSLVALSTEKWCDKDDDGALTVTWDYLQETKMGCEKDPSFAKGRNLVTYAMDLIESRSPANYLSGTKVLAMLLNSYWHSSLIIQLIACGGSTYVLQKLLGTLGTRSPYCGETRRRAGSIVACLAYEKQIRLSQFPGGIQLISSMLEDPQEENEDASHSQVDDGLRILEHLANDEGNRIVMRNTMGFPSSIIARLGRLYRDAIHHHAWARIAGFISELVVAAPGDTEDAGVKLRHEISHDCDAVKALESILNCPQCDPQYRIKTNDVLMDISVEMESNEDDGLICSFGARKEETRIRILVDTFIDVDIRKDPNMHSRVDFAGSQLSELSHQSKSSAKLILMANNDVADHLVTILEKKAYGSVTAEKILNNLCRHYSKDDKCFDRLKKALTNAMSKVLTEMIPQLRQERRAETEEHNTIIPSEPGEDLEIVCEAQENASENWKKGEGRKLKETLTFFCLLARVCDKLISADRQDLSRHFDEIAAGVCLDSGKPVRTLASLAHEAQEALKVMEAQEAQQKRAGRRS